jgi:hypothetical protein
MPEPRVYKPQHRPDCEVLVDGTWHLAELRAWFPNDDGTWRGNVMYSTRPGDNRLDTFPGDRIRRTSP